MNFAPLIGNFKVAAPILLPKEFFFQEGTYGRIFNFFQN